MSCGDKVTFEKDKIIIEVDKVLTCPDMDESAIESLKVLTKYVRIVRKTPDAGSGTAKY